MKKIITRFAFFLFLLTSFNVAATTYTSTGNGDWRTAGSWSPAAQPTSGVSSANQNIIIIQAGHNITISGDLITLSNVVVYVYGRLTMAATLAIPPTYANLNITGTGAGVIIPPGGRLIESAIIDGNLNIRVNGVVVWNGSDDGNITAITQIMLPGGVNNPLPVVLTHWSVESSDNETKANWSTSSETNNDYFTLEESEDGITFYEITKTKAKGNSEVVQHYSYSFASTNKSILYYRLKQTDLDGSSTYSKIVQLFIGKASAGWTIFPNPVTQRAFSIQTDKTLQYILLLDSRSGQEIFRKEFSSADAGSVSVALPDQVKSGLYLLSIQHEEGTETKTLMVY